MKKCILIFDDDPEILYVCKLILKNQNFRVEARTNCNNLIGDIEDVKPDLILIDRGIRGLGADHAVKLIEDNFETLQIPVIVFSEKAATEDTKKRMGVSEFPKKPFDIANFIRLIEIKFR